MAQPTAVAESSQAALKPLHPLPLANSLQSTLALLLSRLGRLLAYQAQLRKAAQSSSSSTNLDIRCVPGFSELTKAAQKWQKDVEALHRWVQRGQDALTIELQKAIKREAIEAEQARVRKAKEEEEERAKEKIKAEELAAKGEEKVDAKDQATGSTADTPVIDLTSDDGPDKNQQINSDGKRSRSEQEGDEDTSKRAKIDSTSTSTDAAPAVATPDPASLLASLTALQSSSSATQSNDQQQQPPTSSNNDTFDFANMPEMDFANFDLSFMNDPNFSMPGADNGGSVTGQSGDNGSSTGLSFDQMYPDATGGGVGGTGSNDDASMMGMMGGGADGGMELGAALQGIDWNNFLSGFDGSAGGSTGQ